MKKVLHNKIIVTIIFLTIVFVISAITISFGMQSYYKVDFSTGLVTATTLNVRSGPGTQFKVVTTVNKNQYIPLC